ncbi:uncharacterized protein LOC114370194 [Glycine soja]|uniref:uncharacterized protein LOC114370194 n=1 Tax=Glycine soja TaxID=3848 RepID=UPI001039E25D|nr:uncharacterized protein LOC114370194 [Glycine soja]
MGEVTITLDDAVQMLVELLMVTAEAARAETGQCRGPYCWIYEHFPSIAESTVDPNYDEDSPRACSWIATKKTVKSIRTLMYRERLDRLRISDVCWIPYGEHRPVQDFHMISCYSGLLRWGLVFVYYRSERVMRAVCQRLHGLVLPYFTSIHDTGPAIRSSGRWSCYAAQSYPLGSRDRYSSDHEASSTVDICKEACDAIAKRLERHLNLGVVTLGTSTHEVIEECLKIVMSVIKDQLVYVRSRRRRHTDQS